MHKLTKALDLKPDKQLQAEFWRKHYFPSRELGIGVFGLVRFLYRLHGGGAVRMICSGPYGITSSAMLFRVIRLRINVVSAMEGACGHTDKSRVSRRGGELTSAHISWIYIKEAATDAPLWDS